MIVVELTQCVFIGLHLGRIVNVLAGDEGENAGFLRGKNAVQARIAKGTVADEVDMRDLGALAFIDLEGQIHATTADIIGLRRDGDVRATDCRVGLLDSLNVAIDHGLAVWAERTRLHYTSQLLILELLVAVENDGVQELVLVDADNESPTGHVDANIREKPVE